MTLTVEDAAKLMIAISDNTAANLILDQLGGISIVNEAMKNLGLDTIRLLSRIDFEIISHDVANLAVASSADLDSLSFMVATGTAFSQAVSAATELLLSQQQYLDQVLRYVKVMPYAEEFREVQPVVSATKTGFHPGVRSDTGIVRFNGGGFTFAASTRGSRDRLFSSEDEGEIANGLIGRLLTEYWWPARSGPVPVIDSPYVRQCDTHEAR